MLSQKLRKRNRILAVCGGSGDVVRGDAFREVCLAAEETFSGPHPGAVCCGRIGEDEPLFHTLDGQIYFSVRDGWGMKDGALYGLELGILYDFGHPTEEETILEECAAQVGSYQSYSGFLYCRDRKRELDRIARAMAERT